MINVFVQIRPSHAKTDLLNYVTIEYLDQNATPSIVIRIYPIQPSSQTRFNESAVKEQCPTNKPDGKNIKFDRTYNNSFKNL